MVIVTFSLPNTVSKLVVRLGVSVPDEEAERADASAQIHGQVASGLSDPLPRRVSGHPPGCAPDECVFRSRTAVQAAQEDRVKVEEIAGQQPAGRTAQKCPPGRVQLPERGTVLTVAQDPPHGRLTKPVAQTEEFAVHSPISPLRGGVR